MPEPVDSRSMDSKSGERAREKTGEWREMKGKMEGRAGEGMMDVSGDTLESRIGENIPSLKYIYI